MRLTTLLVCCLVGLVPSRPVAAQEAATGLISGTVLAAATDAPIDGAQVTSALEPLYRAVPVAVR